MNRYSQLLFSLSFLFFASCNNEVRENKKPESFSSETLSVTPKIMNNPYKDAKIEIKILDNSKTAAETNIGGYGYDIYVFEALFIHQPTIPAVSGNRGFKTKEYANKVAELVTYKIKNNIVPPTVSIHEMDSLKVLE